MINEFRYMSRNGGREKHCTVWDGIYQMLDGKRKERKTATTTNPIRFHFIRLVSCFIMHRSVRLIVNEMKLLLFFTVKQNSHRCWVIKVAVVRYWMTKMHLKAKIDSLGWQKCVIYLIYYSFSQTRLQRALSLTELRCLNFYLTTWLDMLLSWYYTPANVSPQNVCWRKQEAVKQIAQHTLTKKTKRKKVNVKSQRWKRAKNRREWEKQANLQKFIQPYGIYGFGVECLCSTACNGLSYMQHTNPKNHKLWEIDFSNNFFVFAAALSFSLHSLSTGYEVTVHLAIEFRKRHTVWSCIHNFCVSSIVLGTYVIEKQKQHQQHMGMRVLKLKQNPGVL